MEKIYFSNKGWLSAEVQLPEVEGTLAGSMEIFVKVPRFVPWWKFWVNKYEEVPLRITKLTTKEMEGGLVGWRTVSR